MPVRKNILITGASSGIGREMAKQYAHMGRNLALCARRTENLIELKQEIDNINSDITVAIRTLDVNEHEQVFKVFNELCHELGHLDRVIINAGVGKGAPLGVGKFFANKNTATTNFVSAIAQSEAALEIFRAQNYGHLVAVSSLTAVCGFGKAASVYAASKAALSSLSEGLRIDLLNTPIKVTTIHPGYIRSEMTGNDKVMPFIVDTNVGVRAIVKASEKEGASYFVPTWPWALIARILPLLPLPLLAKLVN